MRIEPSSLLIFFLLLVKLDNGIYFVGLEEQTMLEPQFPESYWIESAEQFNQVNHSLPEEIDTIVIGAGITGITLAYLLVKEGVKVALIDADRIIHGATGHTTAKITAQHGLIYDQLINQLGMEKAEQYYRANDAALQFIKNTISQNDIECDFSQQDAFVYTNSEDYFQKLNLEMQAYEKLDIQGELIQTLNIPIPSKLAITMKKQAQFHPVKYLNALVEKFVESGGVLLENTPVKDIEKGSRPKAILHDGRQLEANQLVLATHYPFFDWQGFYFSRLHAERSYVIAVKDPNPFAGGMYISAEKPTRSIRSTPIENGEQLLLIGGESHKTGQGESTSIHYDHLINFASQYFQVKDIPYRWSAQDLVPLNNIPYIGYITKNEKNIYVATGYGKWGMTNGTAGAHVLKDLILRRHNEYSVLYSPSRSVSATAIKNFTVQNADVAKQLVSGKLEIPDRTIEEIGINEGSAVMINGERAGCYKDEDGNLFVVDTTCTHIGCEVKWNSGDRSWDCPCHGSRFSYTGDVLEGPATEPLRKIDLE